MRVAGRAVAGSVAALLVGLAISFVAAAWLRSATPEANLLWGIAPTTKVAAWTLAGSHGVPLRIEAGARLDEDRLGDLGDRLGDIFGNQTRDLIPEAPSADLSIRLVPLTVLALVGAALALVMRSSGARSVTEAVAGALVAGVVHGVGLAALSTVSAARLGVDLAIVRAGVDVSVAPGSALVAGGLWGAVFALLGGFAAPAVAESISGRWRAVGAGLRRAGVVAAVGGAAGLVVMGVTGGGEGFGLPANGKLASLAVALLGVNAVAAAAVISHGAPMQAAFDAGPLAEWSSIGYGSSLLPPTKWLLVLVPLAAGVAAGRVMRRRSSAGGEAGMSALMFGASWGIVLAVLAVLLRVRVLSSFSLGSLNTGGGASINPFVALALGAVLGAVTSYVGFVSGRSKVAQPSAPAVAAPVAADTACRNCGRSLPPGDRFCPACGTPVET